jgi:hypothetical protein
MKIKGSNLVIATQGRAFWILDDLNLLRQYDFKNSEGKLFQTKKTILANWHSSMNNNSATGTDLLQGVNPASGMVFYYNLPKLQPNSEVKLTISDSNGKTVNTYSSFQDSNYIGYEGGPPKNSLLSSKKGINRFVWDMRHSLLKGIPEAYIEGSYKGHKAIPGKYKVNLSYLDKSFEITSQIIKNPISSVSDKDYKSYELFMSEAENIYNEMSIMTNDLHEIENQLNLLMINLKNSGENELYEKAEKLIKKLKKWDRIMVQRLSKAYDDVENFENGFTAHYLTLINAVDSELPQVTNGAKNKMVELNNIWKEYKNQAINVLKPQINQFNVDCQKKGNGALYMN